MSSEPLDFLLELGCEEIPARMIAGAVSDLAERTVGILDSAGLAHGEWRTFSTPRRLAVLVKAVAPRQDDRDEEILGPPVKAAFGADGAPTKAAIGFAQKMGIEPSALQRIPTPKGEYLAVRRRALGRSAGEVLAAEIPRAVAGMTFPKTMRWGDGTRRFVRPVHWVVALLGTEVVPFELLGVTTGAESAGHRILGSKRVPIESPSEYESSLLVQGVVVDREKRHEALAAKLREMAGEAIRALASEIGESSRDSRGPARGQGAGPGAGTNPGTATGKGSASRSGQAGLAEDEALLEEVTDLVEHPGAVLGSFPAEFLSLPREVLVTTLRHHQKAFSTETSNGQLASVFLVVADIDRDPEGHVRRGNEWVVVGRLEDARFFWDEDRKTPLSARREKLENVIFHARAGSYAAKSRRVEEIGVSLAVAVNTAGAPGTAGATAPAGAAGAGTARVDVEAVREASRLAKCDLVTGLVGEFPELQGIAGGLFLRAEADGGESDVGRVADALYDQYLPAGGTDALPSTFEGSILALSDRLDTLGALARTVGLPTGSRDPFGLRRAASGAIRIVAEGPLPLSLFQMWTTTCEALDRAQVGTAEGASHGEWLGFLRERLQFWLESRGAAYDTSNAVLLAAKGERADHETLPRLADKASALQRLRELPDLAALVEIHKRCRNILEQAAAAPRTGAAAAPGGKIDPEEGPAFEALAGGVVEAERAVGAAMGADQFEPALQHLVRLRPALSRFFDHVLVMHPDAGLREKRLGLVRRIAAMIEEVADLKQLAVSKGELKAMAVGPGTGHKEGIR